MGNEKLTICIHFGKKKNYVFLQNFLKSFLICNTYKNIDICIFETSGDKDIRKWLKKINLNNYFINFEGTVTQIKKKKNTNPKLLLYFRKKIFNGNFWVPYMESFIKEAYNNKKGFFIFFAEDVQYYLKGNILEQTLINLKKLGISNNHLGVCVWSKYRYEKLNNKIKNVISFKKNFYLFETFEIKADIFSLISRKIFHKIRKIKPPKNSKKFRHSVISELTSKFKKERIKRWYSSVSPIVSLDNDYHDYFRNKIKLETAINPNYILCKIIDKKEYFEKFKFSNEKLITAEDIYKLNKWGIFWKPGVIIKKSLNKSLDDF